MRIIAVDWSGRARGERECIWLAESSRAVVVRLESGRSRTELADHLVELAASDPELVVGFDFSFSLPAWFLATRGIASADELWDVATREGETWLRECAPPFWGRPGRPRPDLAAHWRATEVDLPPVGGIRPKSTFQIGGAGSVGSGSVRGFPVLARLRAAGFRIWPFHDAPELPAVVEIYPRLFTGAVVKSRAAARRRYLDERLPGADPGMRDDAVASEDAFDALVSAWEMSRHERELRVLPSLPAGSMARTEGTVWVPHRAVARA